jgi:DNA-binding GntR family transcriptional regulator
MTAVTESLVDRAYLALREEIIRVELSPGTVLREGELMERLGVGRTPVREALQRLQRDGFVTVIPRRGTLVSEITITDLAAIYEVRRQLESWASRLAAARATAADRDEAARLVEELEALTPEGGYEALLALDRRIHRFVYRCTKNAFLAETLDQYHNLSLRILHVAMNRYPALTPRLDDVVHEQRQVLQAIRAGDGDTAERVAIAHITTFERAIREVI